MRGWHDGGSGQDCLWNVGEGCRDGRVRRSHGGVGAAEAEAVLGVGRARNAEELGARREGTTG